VLRTGATGDLLSAIEDADLGLTLAVVVLNQPEAVRTLDTRRGKVPAYAYPEAAARALARAARYAQWRGAPHAVVPAFADVDAERGRELVHGFLAARPDGGWLPQADVVALLRLYGIPLDPAAAARSDDDIVVIGVKDDQMFGPLVVLGLAGIDPPAGQAARLAPLTTADADTLISSVRSGPPPPGRRAAPVSGSAAVEATLRDALLRVSRLTEDLPEISELDLNPVIARRDGDVVVVDARIRLSPPVPQDPFLRKLR